MDCGSVIVLAWRLPRTGRLLFDLSKILANIAQQIKQDLCFEFVAIQLIDKEDRTIQTIHATDSMADLTGLAKHPLDRDDTLLDVQAWLAICDPPRIVTICGWNERFDKWIHEKFKHAEMVRVWVPILIVKDGKGNGRNLPSYEYHIQLDIKEIEEKYGNVFIEVIGTVI